MDDAELVRLGDRDARLEHVVDRDLDRQQRICDHRREIRPVEQLHLDVRLARIELADVGDAAHVIALELRARTRLADEPRDHVRIVRQLGVQHLDRDPLLEPDMRRDRDRAHPALAEDALDPQLPRDHRARFEHPARW